MARLADMFKLICRVWGPELMTMEEYLGRKREGLEVPTLDFKVFAKKIFKVGSAVADCDSDP